MKMREDLTPESVPALSENECTLINLFRVLPPKKAQAVLQLIFELALKYSKKIQTEEKRD